MIFKNKENDKRELITLLNQVILLLDNSKGSNWSSLTPEEVKVIIQKEVKNLTEGKIINKDCLIIEFLPTSTLQDIAIDNGWGKEYLKISSRFDKLIEKL